MQGPVTEVLLLMLLILFFGFQQRGRPQLYFRFWFIGWMMLLGSYAVWEVAIPGEPGYLIENSIRNDMLLASGLIFAMSFQAAHKTLTRMLWLGALILIPACLIADLQILDPQSHRSTQIAVFLLALAGRGAVFALIRLGIPPQWKLRRRLFLTISAGMAIFMAVRVASSPSWQVLPAMSFELFFFAALSYAIICGRSLAGILGTIGFAAWAIFYPVNELLMTHPAAQHTLYMFWNMPKYLVGFSMIVRAFEVATAEKDRLADQFQSLYDDFRSLYQNHPHPMWILTVKEGELVAANDIAVSTYGYRSDKRATLRLEDIEVPVDEESAPLAGIVPLPEGSRRSRIRCLNGDVVWVNLYDRPIRFQGAPARLIMLRDVTNFMAFNSELAHRTFHDELTGLPNRRLLQDRLQLAIAATLRQESHVAVIAIDVDHFKQINDNHGHAIGDACLKLVADRLRSRIRTSDTIARVGGEEFIAVVSALRSKEDARKVAMELLNAFKTPLELAGLRLSVTISIGVALCPEQGVDADALHGLADQALYRAKRDGRNCVRMADSADALAARRGETSVVPAGDAAALAASTYSPAVNG